MLRFAGTGMRDMKWPAKPSSSAGTVAGRSKVVKAEAEEPGTRELADFNKYSHRLYSLSVAGYLSGSSSLIGQVLQIKTNSHSHDTLITE